MHDRSMAKGHVFTRTLTKGLEQRATIVGENIQSLTSKVAHTFNFLVGLEFKEEFVHEYKLRANF